MILDILNIILEYLDFGTRIKICNLYSNIDFDFYRKLRYLEKRKFVLELDFFAENDVNYSNEILEKIISSSDNLDLFIKFAKKIKIKKELINYAMFHNRFEIFKYLYQFFKPNMLNTSSLEIVKYLHQRNFEFDLSFYCLSGNLEIIKFLDHKFEKEHMINAIYSGNLELINYFIEKYGIIENISDYFIYKKYYDLAKKYIKYGFSEDLMNVVARSGNLEFFKYLYQIKPILTKEMMRVACLSGNHKLIKFLEDQKCECDFRALSSAVFIGDMKLINHFFRTEYIVNTNCFIENTINHAIKSNNFELVKYLKNKYCLYDFMSLKHAIQTKNVEMIKWIINDGWIWSLDSDTHIARTNDLDLLKWAIDNYCPKNLDTILIASQNNNLEMVKYLLEAGYSWYSSVTSNFIRHGNLEALSLTDNYDIKDMYTAVKYGQLEIVKELLRRNCYYDESVIELADEYLDIKNLLIARRNSQRLVNFAETCKYRRDL